MKYFLTLLLLITTIFSPLSAQNKFLSAEEAFIINAKTIDNKVIVDFSLASDIYVYQEQVSLSLSENSDVELGAYTLPLGHEHDGEMVYYDGQVIEAPLVAKSSNTGLASFELIVNYQGCSGKGLCYEPASQSFSFEVDLAALDVTASDTLNPKVDSDPITTLLSGGNIFYILVGFFIFGLLLSLTPCVFPMIPILSSVIVSHGSEMTTKKAFWLSMVYVQAMAITYTVAGVIAGLTGAGVQAAFQTPWVIVSFAVVFVLLALSMFGLFEIQMPQSLQSYLNKKTEGSGKGYTSIAIMGLLSALIVGPCVAAPLAAALGFISQTGDAFLGGIALYALSMGMGLPLLAVGTGAGKFMPRPGSWMDAVKTVFGVMMLAVAIWMLSRVLDGNIIMLMASALMLFIAASVGAFESQNNAACHPCFGAKKSLGILSLLYGVSLFIGALTHAPSMLNPLEKILPSQVSSQSSTTSVQVQENSFKKIGSISELEAILHASKGKKVMLDFYADWCTSCKELEHLTFADAQVKEALKNYVLIQADITENSDENKELSKKFGLFGPPALIFYDENGVEVKQKRTIGFLRPEQLLEKL